MSAWETAYAVALYGALAALPIAIAATALDRRRRAKMPDITGHCRNRKHKDCSGKLLHASGFHWFCACSCHPVPTEADCSSSAPRRDVEKALATYLAAASPDVPTGEAHQ